VHIVTVWHERQMKMSRDSADGTTFSTTNVDTTDCFFLAYCTTFFKPVITNSTSILEDSKTHKVKKDAGSQHRRVWNSFLPFSFIYIYCQQGISVEHCWVAFDSDSGATFESELVTWCPTFWDIRQCLQTYSGNWLWQFPTMRDIYLPTAQIW
jgi:hypothetical protein